MTTIAYEGAASLRDRPQPRPRSADSVTWLTLYLVVLLAIPSRFVIGPLGSAGAPSMLMGLVSLVLWLSLLLMRRRSAVRLRFYPLRWALGIMIFVSGISYALAMSRPINGDEISPADVALLSLLSWAGTLLLAADTIRTRRRVDDLVWRVAMAGGLFALLGLAQVVTEQSITNLISIPGLSEVSSSELTFRNGFVRPNGTATHPIEYGAIVAMILPLALHVALNHTHRSALLRWMPAVAILAVVGLSGSRSAYLCAIVGVVVCMSAWTPVLRRWMIGLAVGGLVVVSLVYPRIMRFITGLFEDPDQDPSITSRTDSFDFAWTFIAQHPLFGRGFGTFLPKHRIFDNQFLVQLVSVGLIGTIALVALGWVAISEMTRVARTTRGSEVMRTRDLTASMSGAIAAGFVSMAFFDAFAFPMTMGTLFLLLGIAGAISRLDRDHQPSW
ncbi:O-antigen ligase family protein [Microbacterium sp. CGR1]|uniref:O-antigen ligase family protein n=1 Tax=Microbacterium sp. CGR1 TaxID=1696072 RepID=UPI003DA430AD